MQNKQNIRQETVKYGSTFTECYLKIQGNAPEIEMFSVI